MYFIGIEVNMKLVQENRREAVISFDTPNSNVDRKMEARIKIQEGQSKDQWNYKSRFSGKWPGHLMNGTGSLIVGGDSRFVEFFVKILASKIMMDMMEFG